jgi:hypothetical protein
MNKEIDKRIIVIKEEIKIIIAKALEDGRFSFFEFKYVKELLQKCEALYDYDKFLYFYNLIKDWDEKCNLSRNSGEFLESLLRDENSTIAIHRANLDIANLVNIMEEGLINNGHAMQGVSNNGAPALSLTTTPVTSFSKLINVLGSYKNNNVIVVLKFPKEIVDKSLNAKEGIYIKKNDLYYINPNYIEGTIIKQEKGLDKYYSKEELLQQKRKIS